ncbi:MAG TPA: class D sortase [Thermoanaerobaculia bacterium]|nr:class D sortase [Thermoanaerobaculia bacterium]
MSGRSIRARWDLLERAFLVAGVVCLAAAGGMVGYARVNDWLGATELAELTAAEPARAAGAAMPRPRDGVLLGRLDIPRHGLEVLVREGVAEATLLKGAGHVPWTRLPGEEGNVVLIAHRDLHFRPLRAIEKGDLIWLNSLEQVQLYSVVETRIVEPEDRSLLAPGGENRLTLVTCYPFSYIGPAPLRFIVRAVPLGTPRAVRRAARPISGADRIALN